MSVGTAACTGEKIQTSEWRGGTRAAGLIGREWGLPPGRGLCCHHRRALRPMCIDDAWAQVWPAPQWPEEHFQNSQKTEGPNGMFSQPPSPTISVHNSVPACTLTFRHRFQSLQKVVWDPPAPRCSPAPRHHGSGHTAACPEDVSFKVTVAAHTEP